MLKTDFNDTTEKVNITPNTNQRLFVGNNKIDSVSLERKKITSKIFFLPAKYGDAFIIECVRGDAHGLVVVDGGPTGCAYLLQNQLKNLSTPDLMVLTHYDDDHIGGILQLVTTCLDNNTIPAKEVWANCAGYVEVEANKNTSAKQGVTLSVKLNELCKKHNMKWRDKLSEGDEYDYSFAKIEIVSPTKDIMGMVIKKQEDDAKRFLKATKKNTEDLAKPLDELTNYKPKEPDLTKNADLSNASSIAFILRCDNFSVLMLGDSYPQNVEKYLRGKGYSEDHPLEVDYVKVSHHGSKNNTSNSLLDIIQCNNYLISTNGGKNRSNHPDRIAIAHILCHPKRNKDEKVHLYFNHSIDLIEKVGAKFLNDGECNKFNFEIHENITIL